MRNESRRRGDAKTYRLVPVGMSHGTLIHRTAFFFPAFVPRRDSLRPSLIGSDVDLKEGRGVTARLDVRSFFPICSARHVKPPPQYLSPTVSGM